MGVTMRFQKTEASIEFGIDGFFLLRAKIAELSGKEWGDHYAKLANAPMFGERAVDFYGAFENKTERLLKAGAVSPNIASFCLQSDCGGEIPCDACREVLDVIGDYDDDILYGYVGKPDCARIRDFKQLLQECVDNNSGLEWD